MLNDDDTVLSETVMSGLAEKYRAIVGTEAIFAWVVKCAPDILQVCMEKRVSRRRVESVQKVLHSRYT